MSAAAGATQQSSACEWPERAAALFEALRERRTRVHAITNAAAQVLTANLLLAAGGTPSLTVTPDEITAFAARADALLVNLGTLDADRRAAIPWAVATVRAQGKPWVLDPVFAEASPTRLDLARLCIAGKPCVVRCNAAEFAALAGEEASLDAVMAYAATRQTVIALTGPIDWVSDGERFVAIENGDPMMALVTAIGCAATALIAALTALEEDAFVATASGLLLVGIAGEIAGERACGPGSFASAFLDALHALEPADIRSRARLR